MVRRVRLAAIALAIVLGLTGSVALGIRVFAPRDTLTRPTTPYPAAGPIVDERPFSELRAAPLVVDGRLRIYGEKWRVWADGPVGSRYERTPYWSLRRWPAQLLGVVAGTGGGRPVVVSQWSDGQLVAIDARAGTVAWRLTAPLRPRGYDGRRTGASTVYSPRSLLTATPSTDQSGGSPVLILTAPGLVRGYALATGTRLWQRPVVGGCEPQAWTGRGLVAVPDCAGPSISLLSALTGAEAARFTSPDPHLAVQPSHCRLGRTDCPMLAAGEQTWLLSPDASLAELPWPLPDGALLSGDRVVYTTVAGVVSRPLTGNAGRWTWTGQGRLVGADAARVYLLTDDHTVIGLDPTTGRLRVVGCAASKPNETWDLGAVYTTGDGEYLAMERLINTDPDRPDPQYYYGPRPVALVELYPPAQLPVYPAKFAACRPL
jgi:outer membrane protein assembly factor BamB